MSSFYNKTNLFYPQTTIPQSDKINSNTITDMSPVSNAVFTGSSTPIHSLVLHRRENDPAPSKTTALLKRNQTGDVSHFKIIPMD